MSKHVATCGPQSETLLQPHLNKETQILTSGLGMSLFSQTLIMEVL